MPCMWPSASTPGRKHTRWSIFGFSAGTWILPKLRSRLREPPTSVMLISPTNSSPPAAAGIVSATSQLRTPSIAAMYACSHAVSFLPPAMYCFSKYS